MPTKTATVKQKVSRHRPTVRRPVSKKTPEERVRDLIDRQVAIGHEMAQAWDWIRNPLYTARIEHVDPLVRPYVDALRNFLDEYSRVKSIENQLTFARESMDLTERVRQVREAHQVRISQKFVGLFIAAATGSAE
jgi:hypothetical protein